MIIKYKDGTYSQLYNLSKEEWLVNFPDGLSEEIEEIYDDDEIEIPEQELTEEELRRIERENELETSYNALQVTDYKVIKNAEILCEALAEKFGIKLPYPGLHEVRQPYRETINRLEAELYEQSREPSVSDEFVGESE